MEHGRLLVGSRARIQHIPGFGLLESLFCDAPIGQALLDQQCRFVSINEAFSALSGHPVDEHLGQRFSEVFPDLADRAEPLFQDILRVGTPVSRLELTRETLGLDGARHWLVNAYPVRVPDGTNVGIGIVVVEVTDRKRFEAQYTQHRRQQAMVARLGARALAGMDLHTLMQEAVSQVAETLGVEMAEVLELRPDQQTLVLRAAAGWPANLIGRATLSAGADTQLGYTLHTGEPALIEDWRTERRLQPDPVLLRQGVVGGLTVAVYETPKPVALLGVHSTRPRRFTPDDASFLQSVAHILSWCYEHKARLEAEATVRAHELFLSVAAHELRAPLSTLLGYAEIAEREFRRPDVGSPRPDRLRKALSIIARQADKLGDLLGELLDLSRLQSGKLTLNREPTDLVELLQDVVATAMEMQPDGRIGLDAPLSLFANVDPVRIEQVVINLLTNALKFSPPETSVQLSLRLVEAPAPAKKSVVSAQSSTGTPNGVRARRNRRGRPSARLSVRDHGMGIPPTQRAHIFERFYQAHGEGQYGGMGLGLYVCKEVVEAHGGTIWVEAPPDGGTEFVVEVPVG